MNLRQQSAAARHMKGAQTFELFTVSPRRSNQFYGPFQFDRLTAWTLIVVLAERYDPYRTLIPSFNPNVRSDLDGIATGLRLTSGRPLLAGCPFPVIEPGLVGNRAVALSPGSPIDVVYEASHLGRLLTAMGLWSFQIVCLQHGLRKCALSFDIGVAVAGQRLENYFTRRLLGMLGTGDIGPPPPATTSRCSAQCPPTMAALSLGAECRQVIAGSCPRYHMSLRPVIGPQAADSNEQVIPLRASAAV